MRVSIVAELDYFFSEPTDVLLAVEAIPMADQKLIRDRLTVTGESTTLRSVEEHGTPGRRQWTETRGNTRIRYEAVMDVERAALNIAGRSVASRRELPPDVMPPLPALLSSSLVMYSGDGQDESLMISFPQKIF